MVKFRGATFESVLPELLAQAPKPGVVRDAAFQRAHESEITYGLDREFGHALRRRIANRFINTHSQGIFD